MLKECPKYNISLILISKSDTLIKFCLDLRNGYMLLPFLVPKHDDGCSKFMTPGDKKEKRFLRIWHTILKLFVTLSCNLNPSRCGKSFLLSLPVPISRKIPRVKMANGRKGLHLVHRMLGCPLLCVHLVIQIRLEKKYILK